MTGTYPQIVRPLTSDFQAIIQKHADAGLKIIPIEGIGSPSSLRSLLGLQMDDYVVCAFMAGRPPQGIADIGEIARAYPRTLAQLDHQYQLQMPRLSGGGNWQETPDETGLMGAWATGATENGHPAYFVTKQDLVEKEGLPLSQGTAACLKLLPDENRLGERTDGLLAVGDLFVIFPGGLGTLAEWSTKFSNISIHPKGVNPKGLILDPLCLDPKTGERDRLWEDDLKSLVKKNHHGMISDEAAAAIDSNCIRYLPDPRLTPHQVCREMMSLTLAIRTLTLYPEAETGLAALHPELRKNNLIPLSPGSEISEIFGEGQPDGSWIRDLRRIVKPTSELLAQEKACRVAFPVYAPNG